MNKNQKRLPNRSVKDLFIASREEEEETTKLWRQIFHQNATKPDQIGTHQLEKKKEKNQSRSHPAYNSDSAAL